MSNLTERKETTQDKILNIFREVNYRKLTGEEAVILFEERYGRNSTSDVVRTNISALTRKGLLLEMEEVYSSTTKELVKTWVFNDGPVVELPSLTATPRQQGKQALEMVPAIKDLLTRLDKYFSTLPEGSKQEVLHYEVNNLLEKL